MISTAGRLFAASMTAAALLAAAAWAQTPAATKATPLMSKALAGIAGKEGMMLRVDMPPGAESPPHRHNANTFVYVMAGSVLMQVAGGPLQTLRAGDTFYESPTDIHSVAKNASATEPASLLVFFVKEQGAPASLPAK